MAQKVGKTVFTLKSSFLKEHKTCQFFGHFCKKYCRLSCSKILAQSGHTGCGGVVLPPIEVVSSKEKNGFSDEIHLNLFFN